MWQEPKTDWLPTDYFNFEDYNRIKNNISYLREQALKLYINFPFTEMGSDKEGYLSWFFSPFVPCLIGAGRAVPTDARRRFDYLIIVSVQIPSISLNLFS